MTPADTLLRTWLRATADRWERAASLDPPDFLTLADMPRRPGDVTIAEIVEAARRLAEVEVEDEPADYERAWVPFDSLGADGGWTRMDNPCTADRLEVVSSGPASPLDVLPRPTFHRGGPLAPLPEGEVVERLLPAEDHTPDDAPGDPYTMDGFRAALRAWDGPLVSAETGPSAVDFSFAPPATPGWRTTDHPPIVADDEAMDAALAARIARLGVTRRHVRVVIGGAPPTGILRVCVHGETFDARPRKARETVPGQWDVEMVEVLPDDPPPYTVADEDDGAP